VLKMSKLQEKISNIGKLSFEQAMTQLEQIVNKLESGQESLETAMDDYEYGNALRQYCQKKLNDAKLKVDKVVRNDSGEVRIGAAE
jgi:exodeoxyribonuclease VII small subunit